MKSFEKVFTTKLGKNQLFILENLHDIIHFMIQEIKKFWKGDIENSDETLEKYSHDASIFSIKPQIVLFPKDSEDVSNLTKWINDQNRNLPHDQKINITMRAAGTCMSGGPLGESFVLDTTRFMNKVHVIEKLKKPIKILPVFPGSQEVKVTGYTVVDPGVYYRDFEPLAKDKGLLLPCYTASKSLNALGGMVGNNSGGELTLRYGKTEDYVAELEVVLRDGNIYTIKPITRRELYKKITEQTAEGEIYKRMYELIKSNEITIAAAKPNVTKNSAGYYLWNVLTKSESGDEMEDVFDLCKLVVGSQGTLCAVTKIKFYLVDAIPKSKLMVVFLKDFNNIGEIVDRLLATGPISIESYDDKTFWLAVKFFKDFVKNKGFFSTLKFGLEFLPEVLMTLFGGVPKLIILSEYAGKDEKEIDKKARAAKEVIKDLNLRVRVTKSSREAEKYWQMRRDSFALLRKHVAGKKTAPFIDDVIVRSEYLSEFLPKVNELVAAYPNLVYTIAGHAENGNFHIIPLVDPKDPTLKDVVLELSDKVYKLVLSYGGSITAEHNDGIVRTPYLSMMYDREVINLFEETKDIFDPQNIFNPNKKVRTNMEFFKDHMTFGVTNAHSS